VPVPVRVRAVVFDASLVMVADAVKVPTAFGLNVTLTGVLWPAVRVRGRLGVFRVKYWVEMATLLIVTVAGPELVAVADRVSLVPAWTLPKFNVADEMFKELGWVWFDPALKPWQPARKARPAIRRSEKATLARFEQLRLVAVPGIKRGTGIRDSLTVWTGGRLIPDSLLLACAMR
jgi:hypothetical protein